MSISISVLLLISLFYASSIILESKSPPDFIGVYMSIIDNTSPIPDTVDTEPPDCTIEPNETSVYEIDIEDPNSLIEAGNPAV